MLVFSLRLSTATTFRKYATRKPSSMQVQGGLDVREARIFGIHVQMSRPHCMLQNREFGMLPQQNQSH
jgi:hypothetical protein